MNPGNPSATKEPLLPVSRNGKPAATASSILTTFAHRSASFFSTFLVIRLSGPTAANGGRLGLASDMQLLRRELHQTAYRERYLLLASRYPRYVERSHASRPHRTHLLFHLQAVYLHHTRIPPSV
ncbi:hypothetical protein EDD17DRAFT_1155084 [Pisolithus thermaeus]|nr:hypothetical protein EDD17DRAFT_1155084 [Pisolithus thermaeus]